MSEVRHSYWKGSLRVPKRLCCGWRYVRRLYIFGEVMGKALLWRLHKLPKQMHPRAENESTMFRSTARFAASSDVALAQTYRTELFFSLAGDDPTSTIMIQCVGASATAFARASSTAQSSCEWCNGVDYIISDSSAYEATRTGDVHALMRACKGQRQGKLEVSRGGLHRIGSARHEKKTGRADHQHKRS